MVNAIIVHGWVDEEEYFDEKCDTASNSHWIPWLSKQLQIKGYKVDAPENTQHGETTYESWKTEFERFDVSEQTVLIGHSLGGGFLIRYLSEHPELKISKLVLVAAWLGHDADHYPEFDKSFFDFNCDPNLLHRVRTMHVMYSLDDEPGTIEGVKVLKQLYPGATYHEFSDKGHFTLTSLGTIQFPELLELCA